MSEYIKREDVIMEISADNSLSSHDSVDRFSIIDRMKRIPAADVEPVVRCKDCIESGSNMKRSTFCYLFDKEMDMDFYCANGKEKNA